MDTATSGIRAVAFTPGSDGDSPFLPELPDQIPEGEVTGTVTADGACDTCRCRTAIFDRQSAEIRIRVAPMNRFDALGTAGIVRIDCSRREKGNACLGHQSHNSAAGNAFPAAGPGGSCHKEAGRWLQRPAGS